MQPRNRIIEARKLLNNLVLRLIVKETKESVLERWVRVRKLVSELRKGFAFSPIIVTPSEPEISLQDKESLKLIEKTDELYRQIRE